MIKKNKILLIGVLLVLAIGVYAEKYLFLSQGLATTAHAVFQGITIIKEKVVGEIKQVISTIKITSVILLGIFTSCNVNSRLFDYKK